MLCRPHAQVRPHQTDLLHDSHSLNIPKLCVFLLALSSMLKSPTTAL